MIRRPPRSTLSSSSAASDVYKRQVKFFKVNIVAAVAALITLIFVGDQIAVFAILGIVGFTIANVFPIIFGMAIQSRPDKANEISGLMITGVFGGAVIP